VGEGSGGTLRPVLAGDNTVRAGRGRPWPRAADVLGVGARSPIRGEERIPPRSTHEIVEAVLFCEFASTTRKPGAGCTSNGGLAGPRGHWCPSRAPSSVPPAMEPSDPPFAVPEPLRRLRNASIRALRSSVAKARLTRLI
jgi:hypothetical protein